MQPVTFSHPYDPNLNLAGLFEPDPWDEDDDPADFTSPQGLQQSCTAYLDMVLGSLDPGAPMPPLLLAFNDNGFFTLRCNYNLAYPGAEAAFGAHHLPGLAYLIGAEHMALMLSRGEGNAEAVACFVMMGDGTLIGSMVPVARHPDGIATGAAFAMTKIPKQDLRLLEAARKAVVANCEMGTRRRQALAHWTEQE